MRKTTEELANATASELNDDAFDFNGLSASDKEMLLRWFETFRRLVIENERQPVDCQRCAELQQDLQTTADALGHIQCQFESVNQDRDDWIACHAKIFRELQDAKATVAQLAENMLRLIETVKYLLGIAERGTQSVCPDDMTVESFVLGYVKELESDNRKQAEQLEAAQARIDALMLEYCPKDMTPEQLANYAAHQRPATH